MQDIRVNDALSKITCDRKLVVTAFTTTTHPS